MSLTSPSTRREPRHMLRPGSSWVEFVHPGLPSGARRAALVSISVSGLALEARPSDPDLPDGTCLDGVTLRIGRCALKGDLVLRTSYRSERGTPELGCLFYPAPQYEDRWMVLNAGIDAARRD